jgi:hypothetical protein
VTPGVPHRFWSKRIFDRREFLLREKVRETPRSQGLEVATETRTV